MHYHIVHAIMHKTIYVICLVCLASDVRTVATMEAAYM